MTKVITPPIWTVETIRVPAPGGEPGVDWSWGSFPNPNWWSMKDAGYSPGILFGRRIPGGGLPFQCQSGGTWYWSDTFTHLTFIAPDGTEHALYDRADVGVASYNCANLGAANRLTVFESKDGAGITFIADGIIVDVNTLDMQDTGQDYIFPSGWLMFRDGTRYYMSLGHVGEIFDRNGNLTTFSYDQYARLTQVTDSLNRVATIQYDASDTGGTHDRIIFKRFDANGAVVDRVIKVYKTALQDELALGQVLKKPRQLFNELPWADDQNFYNPTVDHSLLFRLS